jgi:hypothetical protein
MESDSPRSNQQTRPRPAAARRIDQMRKGTTTLAILKLLIDVGEPMHGYQIIRELESRSQSTQSRRKAAASWRQRCSSGMPSERA